MAVMVKGKRKKDRRAASWEQIEPLQDLCEQGKLFEVQEWIAKGLPINGPEEPPGKSSYWSPLEIALKSGFHSLVKVLLEAGARIDMDSWETPLTLAMQQRRLDLAQLLIENGLSMGKVNMRDVFECWDPEIMEYFIDLGASPVKDDALAYALCSRIRTALRIVKKYGGKYPEITEQVNIALRFHARGGNEKWVALMLWAGGDPYKCGPSRYHDDTSDDDSCYSALIQAAVGGNFNVLKAMVKKRFDPDHEEIFKALQWCAVQRGSEVTEFLIEKGLNLAAHPDWTTAAIQTWIRSMSWSTLGVPGNERRQKIDTDDDRNILKNIHLIVKHGARWMPNSGEIATARYMLKKMAADYTTELVWIMSQYNGCEPVVLQNLLKTQGIRIHTISHGLRMQKMIAGMSRGTTETGYAL